MSGTKFDNNKIPLELIPSEALFEIGKVLDAGRKKYGTANWAKGIEISRLLGASMRHIMQFNAGEDMDEETGTLHVANAACNLLFAIWMMKNRPDMDDRWEKKVEPKKELIQMSFFVPNGMDLQDAIHKGEALCINSDYLSGGDDCE
jgi:hypothetical protein